MRRTYGDGRLAHELAAEAIDSLRRNYRSLMGTSDMHREILGSRNALHDVFFYLMLDDEVFSEAASFLLAIGLEMRVLTSLNGAPPDEDIMRSFPESLIDRFVSIRDWLERTPVGPQGRAIVDRVEGVLRSVAGRSPREILDLLDHQR